MPAPGAFTYSRAVREWAFVQVPLVSLSDFRKAAAERDVMKISPFDASPWETLDREGLLPPVAYALHGFWHDDQPANLENGDSIVREERGFVAWDELRAEARERNGADLYVLYGHWQLLSLVTIVDHLSPSTPLLALGRGLDEFHEARVAYASAPIDRERLSDVARANRAEELLLIRVQNLFMPSVRGGRYRGGPVVGLTEEAADWAIEQRRTFDYAAAAEDCEVTAEDLERLFDAFATRAHWIDPLERWFHLADQVKRRERERLKGAALRALDLYDAARVVRSWHAQLAGEPLPDVDELFGIHPKEAKRRMYGTDELRGNCEVLPALLEHFGLYPWRVQLIAEGKSDLAMLEEVLAARYDLSFGYLGIHAFALGGADIPANAELILGAVRVYSNYYLLLFDNEGRPRQNRGAGARRPHRGRLRRPAQARARRRARRGAGAHVRHRRRAPCRAAGGTRGRAAARGRARAGARVPHLAGGHRGGQLHGRRGVRGDQRHGPPARGAGRVRTGSRRDGRTRRG
ncbi:hypothetical protein [Thermoleophilum album]|uniref:Uncharacterized protein n=1 Tax=Thermoleophilum album TaxID=29539 RepID=A0A1H6FJR4_THEAL|nr:hypothetical protein [Thermoleophilum album]SEH10460.1 hypothetical protein SAMN02745716_0313 [Thermoleophilum album]